MTAESDLQRAIRKAYARNGWMTLKMNPDGIGIPNGWPDLLCIGPNKRIVFIEVKKPGNRPTALQEHTLTDLQERGFRALWADNLDTATEPLRES